MNAGKLKSAKHRRNRISTMRLMSLKNNERLPVHRIKQKHACATKECQMQVALSSGQRSKENQLDCARRPVHATVINL